MSCNSPNKQQVVASSGWDGDVPTGQQFPTIPHTFVQG